MKQGLAILFPGTGYTCEQPLLVKCADIYKSLGYDVVKLDFSSIKFNEIQSIDMAFEMAKAIILKQLEVFQVDDYIDIVFISKSFGTVCAGWLEEYWCISPRQLLLTPIMKTLNFIKDTTKVIAMVIGTEDKLMDYQYLNSYCIERKISCIICQGVGHGLLFPNDPKGTAEINEQILALCR